MMKTRLLLCAALAGASSAWAIHKCTGADGKISYQDAPCTGKGQKIEIQTQPANANPPSPAPPAATPQPGAAASKEGAFGPNWQRMSYLQNRGIPDARDAVYRHNLDCRSKQAELAQRKILANNNLAGATLELAIATEMQVTAAICESKARELRGHMEAMEKELRELRDLDAKR